MKGLVRDQNHEDQNRNKGEECNGVAFESCRNDVAGIGLKKTNLKKTDQNDQNNQSGLKRGFRLLN